LQHGDEYLNRSMKSYGAICYINRHTPKNAGIKLLFLDSLGCTHLLVRTELYLLMHNNYTLETRNQLFQQMGRAMEMIYNANGYEVYRLIPPR
jgi:hypothetical protein